MHTGGPGFILGTYQGTLSAEGPYPPNPNLVLYCCLAECKVGGFAGIRGKVTAMAMSSRGEKPSCCFPHFLPMVPSEHSILPALLTCFPELQVLLGVWYQMNESKEKGLDGVSYSITCKFLEMQKLSLGLSNKIALYHLWHFSSLSRSGRLLFLQSCSPPSFQCDTLPAIRISASPSLGQSTPMAGRLFHAMPIPTRSNPDTVLVL